MPVTKMPLAVPENFFERHKLALRALQQQALLANSLLHCSAGTARALREELRKAQASLRELPREVRMVVSLANWTRITVSDLDEAMLEQLLIDAGADP